MAKGQNRGRNQGRNGQNRGRNRNRTYQRASGNIELQDQSQVDLLNQQLQQAQQDYLREFQAARSIYGGGGEEIRDLPRPEFGQIQDDFSGALEQLRPMFAGDEYMADTEQAAGLGLGGAYGEAGATMLANMAGREGMARSSAAREANLSGRYAQDALIQRMEDALQGYNDQLGQVRADDPWQLSQEVDRLREEAFERQAVKSKLKSDDAFSQWLQGYLGGAGGSFGGGGRPGGGGGGPGGGGGGGMPDPALATPGVPRANTDPTQARLPSGAPRPANWENWRRPRRQRYREQFRGGQGGGVAPQTPDAIAGSFTPPAAPGSYSPNPIYQVPTEDPLFGPYGS